MKSSIKSAIAIMLCIFMLLPMILASCDDGLLDDGGAGDITLGTSPSDDKKPNDDKKQDAEDSESEKITESENVTDTDNSTDSDDSTADDATDADKTEGEDISFEGLTVNGTDISGVVANSVTEFDFKNKIALKEGLDYVLSLDEYGIQTVVTKRVPLSEGDNKYYVIVTKGNDYVTYNVTIRRRPMYVVSFNTNGGTAVADQRVEEGSTVSLPTTTREGYSFVGWSRDLSLPITDNITVLANWSGSTYTVTYDANGGSVASPTESVVMGENYTLKTPTRDGYSFDCWLHGSKYVALSGEWSIPENATLKAEWIPNGNIPYKVEHYIEMLDGSYKLMDTDELKGNADGKVTPATKSYTGFTAPAKQEATVSVDGSLVVEYRYKRNSYKVNYVTNGGNEMDPKLVKYEQALTELEDAIREGYTFGGWFSNVALTKAPVEAMPASDITVYAYWTEEEKPGNFEYYGTNSVTVKMHSSAGSSNGILRIPTYIGGVLVGAIDTSGFDENDSLKTVIIPYGVTSISTYAFSPYDNLMNIIVDDANTAYKSIDGNLYTKDGLTLIKYASGKIATSFTVPDGVTEIAKDAFYECTLLTSISLPNSLTSIGELAFYGCSNLASVSIPSGVTKINKYAFYVCSNLLSVTLSEGLIEIGDYAFGYCKKLESINLPNGLTSIGKYAFDFCSMLSSITIPSTVTSIGDSAFGFCSSLTSIEIPSSITSLSNSMLYHCTGLKSITIPNSVTVIGSGAIRGCSSLTSITIPNSVTTICNDAFSDCDGLTSIVIPNSVTSIESCAFSYCDNLTSIYIPESVTSIGNHTFNNSNKLSSVIFENPNGWEIRSVAISATDLADPSIAATYLKSTYYEYTWTRK